MDSPSALPLPNLLTSRPNLQAEQDVEKASSSEASADLGPSQEYVWCGIDFKPVLPAVLAVSTVVGAACVFLMQIPLLSHFTGLSQGGLTMGLAAVYAVVMACGVYCTFCDPGQLQKSQNTGDIEEGMPGRTHRSWQYQRPIRRYDHYCKYLKNVIGLLNHREFVLMVGGLVLIAAIGILIDIWLAILIAEKGFFGSEIVVALHLAYSVALLAIVAPILRIHVDLISRNQTAKEWKEKIFYVANNTTLGDNVFVEDLEDDEYNEFFDRDAFIYDQSRNPLDRGCFTNCFTFWCQPRWPADVTGDF